MLPRYHMHANALGIDWWDWMTELDKRRNKVPRSSPPLKLPDSPSYSFSQSDDDVHVALDENGCIV